jgi:hypothetical protein
MPIAVRADGQVFIASDRAVFQVNDDGSTAPVVSLEALNTLRMPGLLAIRGDGFVVGISGTGGETTSWLHEVDAGGQQVATVELHCNRGHDLKGIAVGDDALLVEAGALFRVDGMGAPQEIEGGAPLAVLGPHHALTQGGWDPATRRAQSFLCRFEGDTEVVRLDIPGTSAPNLIALGNGWESWTQGSKLFVHREGEITKLRAGGWVTALASDGDRLASAALSASKPALLVWG